MIRISSAHILGNFLFVCLFAGDKCILVLADDHVNMKWDWCICWEDWVDHIFKILLRKYVCEEICIVLGHLYLIFTGNWLKNLCQKLGKTIAECKGQFAAKDAVSFATWRSFWVGDDFLKQFLIVIVY